MHKQLRLWLQSEFVTQCKKFDIQEADVFYSVIIQANGVFYIKHIKESLNEISGVEMGMLVEQAG